MIFKEYVVPAVLCAGLVVCVATGFVAYNKGYDARGLKDAAKISELNQKYADQKTEFIKASKLAQDKSAENIAAIDAKHLKEKQNERERTEATVANYRSDNLRLRNSLRPASCPAGGGTKSTSGSGVGDAAESVGLRDADVEFLVRIAGEADEVTDTLRACQGVILEYQDLYRRSWPSAAKGVLEGGKSPR